MNPHQKKRLEAWARAWRARDAKAHHAAFKALTDADVRIIDFRLRVDGGDLARLVNEVLS